MERLTVVAASTPPAIPPEIRETPGEILCFLPALGALRAGCLREVLFDIDIPIPGD